MTVLVEWFLAYSKLLEKLKPYDLTELGRIVVSPSGDATVMIGSEQEVMVPFVPTCHTLRSPGGAQDFYVQEDDVLSLLERFKIPLEGILIPPPHS
jgi:hypothetical protein